MYSSTPGGSIHTHMLTYTSIHTHGRSTARRRGPSRPPRACPSSLRPHRPGPVLPCPSRRLWALFQSKACPEGTAAAVCRACRGLDRQGWGRWSPISRFHGWTRCRPMPVRQARKCRRAGFTARSTALQRCLAPCMYVCLRVCVCVCACEHIFILCVCKLHVHIHACILM